VEVDALTEIEARDICETSFFAEKGPGERLSHSCGGATWQDFGQLTMGLLI
jgi:hypothetical protein